MLGQIAFVQGDYAIAQNFFEESARLYREIQDEAGLKTIVWLGRVLDKQQRYEQATACYEENLEIVQKIGNQLWCADVYGDFGFLALHQQHWQHAHTHFAESLRLYSACDHTWGVLECLVGLAGVAEGQGHAEQAAHLLGAREAFLDIRPDTFPGKSHESLLLLEQDRYEDIVTTVRTALGEEAFAAALAKGRAMTLEQAIEYALTDSQQNSRS